MENYRFDVVPYYGKWAILDTKANAYVSTKAGAIRKFGIKSNAEAIAVRLEKGWVGHANAPLGVSA